MIRLLSLRAPSAGGLRPIPSQGTRSHMLQLGAHRPQLKMLPAGMKIENPTCCHKTWHCQINIKKIKII